MNIVASIRQETQGLGERIAAVEGSRQITYHDLLTRVADLKEVLLRLGVAPGQRIAFRCTDGIDYILGALALLDCGAAVVPVADSLTEAEIQDTIQRIDVHGILTESALAQGSAIPAAEPVGEAFIWQARRALEASDRPCMELGAAFIRFSSGTTGASKGVVLSHRSILERTDAANRGLQITQRDVILWVLGMSHHFVVSILLFLRKGATIVIANRDFPFSLLDAAQGTPVSFIYASPVHYHLLASADAVAPQALSQVRLAISTAMKMPRPISVAFAAKFGFAPAEAYGIIEVGLPFLNCEVASGGEGTVGRMLPDYQLRIADPDAEGIGQVLLRGQGMFDAYFSPWRLREDCLTGGWFSTGDLGKLDSAGRLCLLGRCKTVIVCAGMKVFPEEVEAVINAHGQVAESLVYGEEHPQFGQVPVARIVAKGGTPEASQLAERLRRHCCKTLSPYKVPVDFQLVAALPKTPSGKLRRS